MEKHQQVGALSQSYVWNSASSELFVFGKSSLLAELGYTPEFSTKAQDNSTVWAHTTCRRTSAMFTVFCTFQMYDINPLTDVNLT